MKRLLFFSIAAITSVPLAAHASCDDLIKQISKKIEAKGAPTSQFKLEAVPNNKADKADGKIVGTCNGGTRKVIYTRQWHAAKTSEAQQVASSTTQRSNSSNAKADIPPASATDQTTPEESQPAAQPQSNRQTTPEEAQSSASSNTNEQTAPEESQPSAQSSSENLPSIEDRYKFLLEGTQSPDTQRSN